MGQGVCRKTLPVIPGSKNRERVGNLYSYSADTDDHLAKSWWRGWWLQLRIPGFPALNERGVRL